jgi:hypothetical protein
MKLLRRVFSKFIGAVFAEAVPPVEEFADLTKKLHQMEYLLSSDHITFDPAEQRMRSDLARQLLERARLSQQRADPTKSDTFLYPFPPLTSEDLTPLLAAHRRTAEAPHVTLEPTLSLPLEAGLGSPAYVKQALLVRGFPSKASRAPARVGSPLLGSAFPRAPHNTANSAVIGTVTCADNYGMPKTARGGVGKHKLKPLPATTVEHFVRDISLGEQVQMSNYIQSPDETATLNEIGSSRCRKRVMKAVIRRFSY